MLRVTTLLLFALALSGCFHVQLNGGVAGAQVSVAPLDRPQQLLSRLSSQGPQTMIARKGQAAWDVYNDYLKTIWMGVVFLPAGPVEDSRLYLVTARGGENLDSDMNLLMDDVPVRVRGEWHAIVPGYKFRETHNSVSLLTEACYQWLLSRYPGQLPEQARILEELDAAARRMVEDINRDGVVDYNDVLVWNIYASARQYRGEKADLLELAMLVSLGFPREQISRVSHRIVEPGPAPQMPGPGFLDYLHWRIGRWL
jgi:hypothetical protein